MKKLINFINESLMINEAVDYATETDDRLKFKKTKETLPAFMALDYAFNHIPNREYSLNSKTAIDGLFKSILKNMNTANEAEAKRLLLTLNIRTPKDFIIFLNTNMKFLIDNHFKVKNIKWKLTPQEEKELKVYKRSEGYTELVRFYPDKYEGDDPNDDVRLLVVYDADNPTDLESTYAKTFYGRRNLANQQQSNNIKYEWTSKTGIPYTRANTILAYKYMKDPKFKA